MLSPKSKLLRAVVAVVYCKMMKPLLVVCIESVPSLVVMIKMGEEIDSITGEKIKKTDVSCKTKLKKLIVFGFS